MLAVTFDKSITLSVLKLLCTLIIIVALPLHILNFNSPIQTFYGIVIILIIALNLISSIASLYFSIRKSQKNSNDIQIESFTLSKF